MIYANHNFIENYKSADGTKDDVMKQTIVLDEVAKTILHNKRDVVSLLRKNGINATYNDSIPRITELSLLQFGSNDKFVKDFKNLIVSNHKNADGDGVFANADAVKIADGLDAEIRKIGKARLRNKGKSKKEKGKGDNKTADDILKDRVKIAEAKMNAEGNAMPTWKKWTLIGAGLALLTTGIILYIRKMKKDKEQSFNEMSSPQPPTISNDSDSDNDNDNEQ